MAAATTQGEATASTRRAADPRPVRPGQVVAAQVAVALPIAASGHGPLMTAAAVIAGGALIALAWARMRRRWLFEWAALGIRYRARSHTLPAGASAADLLGLVAPDSTVDETGVVSDRHGLTVILELGDSTLLRDSASSTTGDADRRPPLARPDRSRRPRRPSHHAAPGRHAVAPARPTAPTPPRRTAHRARGRTAGPRPTTADWRPRPATRRTVARTVEPAPAGRPGAPADPRTAAARRIAGPRTADRWRAARHVLPAAERRSACSATSGPSSPCACCARKAGPRTTSAARSPARRAGSAVGWRRCGRAGWTATPRCGCSPSWPTTTGPRCARAGVIQLWAGSCRPPFGCDAGRTFARRPPAGWCRGCSRCRRQRQRSRSAPGRGRAPI